VAAAGPGIPLFGINSIARRKKRDFAALRLAERIRFLTVEVLLFWKL
jgi:hypothetical protein